MNQVYILYICLCLLAITIVGIYFGFSAPVFIVLLILIIIFGLILLSSMLYSLIRIIKEQKMYVPYVPTKYSTVKAMIDLAKIQEGDNVYDLGCGDGRIVIEASKIKNTKCIGIEWRKDVYFMAKVSNFLKKGNAVIKNGDMYKLDISDANIIFTYLLTNAMDRIEEKIINECKDGTVIVSHGFQFKTLDLIEEVHVDRTTIRKYKLNKKI